MSGQEFFQSGFQRVWTRGILTLTPVLYVRSN